MSLNRGVIDRWIQSYKPVMGIEISLWRARVGSFSQPIECKSVFPVLKVCGVLLCVRVVLFLLLAVNGVETNPGPGPGGSGAADKGRGGSTSSSSRGRGWVGGIQAKATSDY